MHNNQAGSLVEKLFQYRTPPPQKKNVASCDFLLIIRQRF